MSFDQDLVSFFNSKTGLTLMVQDTSDGYNLTHWDVMISVEIKGDTQIIKSAKSDNIPLTMQIIEELKEEHCGPYYHSLWAMSEDFEVKK